MSFTPISPTDPRTNPWNFGKKILRIHKVEYLNQFSLSQMTIGLSSSFPNYTTLYRYDSIVYKMHFIYIDCIEKWVREEGRMFAKE